MAFAGTIGYHAVDARRNQPIGQMVEHDPRVDDDVAVGGSGVDPDVVSSDLEAGRCSPGQGGNQVDVAMLGRPDVLVEACLRAEPVSFSWAVYVAKLRLDGEVILRPA